MRRIVLLLLCIAILAVPVSAVSSVTSARNQTQVATDGTCQITLALTLQLEESVSGLVFPLPKQAYDISVNGTSVKGIASGSTRNVDLTDFVSGAGTYSLVLRYGLSGTVTESTGGKLTLTLPLLSGFSYPVDDLSFSVTLPGEPNSTPDFTSTYYQETVAAVMDLSVEGAVISGTFLQRLQDHETLIMTLAVSEDLFPDVRNTPWAMDTVDILTFGFGALAVLYWLLTMGCKWPKRTLRATPPEGITAGELGCRLSGQGLDLTLTVVSWAQMGYLLIQPDDNGRVLLHKRMQMGNERSEFENRYFRALFGKRKVVDGTGYHYARLCRKARRHVPGRRLYYRRNSGNPAVFRGLAVAAGVFNGISLASAFVSNSGWRVVLSVLLGSLGGLAAWQIQAAMKSLHSRNKWPLLTGLAAGALWILLSIPAGEWGIGLFSVIFHGFVGFAAAYGGRRSESGTQAMRDILGLRRHLKTVKPEDLKRILRENPNYYYELVPYALALGVDRAFSRRLGRARLPECTYLTTGLDGHLTAQEWTQLLRETVRSLDALQLRLPLDRFLGK